MNRRLRTDPRGMARRSGKLQFARMLYAHASP